MRVIVETGLAPVAVARELDRFLWDLARFLDSKVKLSEGCWLEITGQVATNVNCHSPSRSDDWGLAVTVSVMFILQQNCLQRTCVDDICILADGQVAWFSDPEPIGGDTPMFRRLVKAIQTGQDGDESWRVGVTIPPLLVEE
ncbi:hypothetical protein KW786_00515 [Candidatus Parcubacteria bacterium]|nr:hypothetical protein [Candidatus Parcubacteria bacterium]